MPAGIRFDVIVSNPPYIAQSEWETLDASVRIWEDRQALIAAENGLHILHTIISQAPSYIKANAAIIQHHIPQLLVEIGYQQGDMVTPFFKAAGFQKVHIEKDLAGLDRIVTGYNNYVVQPLT